MTRVRLVVAAWVIALLTLASCDAKPTGRAHPSPAKTPSGCVSDTRCPSKRIEEGLAFDQDRQTLVLFAGSRSPDTVAGGGLSVLGDTWEWHLGSGWVQLHPAISPPARTAATMVYDPATHQSLLLGGSYTVGGTVACDEFGQVLCSNDMWAWNGTDWTELHARGNPILYGSTAAYDQATRSVLLYTFDFGIYKMWTLSRGTWASKPGLPSPGRVKPSMTFDPATRHSLLFGGFSQGAGNLAAMWTWSGRGWARLGVNAPLDRFQRSAATGWFDGRGILAYQNPEYDGNPPNQVRQVRSQTWRWGGTRWTKLKPEHDPDLFVSAMFDDPKGHRVLMVGVDLNGSLQIWAWSGSDWGRIG